LPLQVAVLESLGVDLAGFVDAAAHGGKTWQAALKSAEELRIVAVLPALLAACASSDKVTSIYQLPGKGPEERCVV
jgi:hypothetical protein